MIAGLLGEKLGHSYSPQIHSLLSDYEYKLFEVQKDDLGAFLKSNDFDCLNVTIPYKRDVLEYVDEISPISKRLRSANTIVKQENGKLFATNTDYYGFLKMLEKIDVKNKSKALVLGTGGASGAIYAALEDFGFKKIVYISRTGNDNYSNISKHKDANVIVNTTPVGMYPNNMLSPIDNLDIFGNLEAVYDIIYNPKRTKLLFDCQKRGIKCSGGLYMLVSQAAKSCYYFTGKEISDEKIIQITNTLDKQMQNIVLIGMPGCGKSTISRLISKKLLKRLIDTDLEFEKVYGVKPGDFIIRFGEVDFRNKETKIIKDVSKLSGCVIATGGGVVERAENYDFLRQNSIIIYVKRELKLLSTSSRPLSKNIEELFTHRRPLYENLADICVENSHSVDFCADKIIDLIDNFI